MPIAHFFEPGTYGSAAGPLIFQVGYYTQVAGLGAVPQDTVVNGASAFAVIHSGGRFSTPYPRRRGAAARTVLHS